MKSNAAAGIAVRRSAIDEWYRKEPVDARLVEEMLLPQARAATQPVASGLRLRDFSWRRRCGCQRARGRGGLSSFGLRIPSSANAAALDAGVLVARLATSEFLVEALNGNERRVEATRAALARLADPRTSTRWCARTWSSAFAAPPRLRCCARSAVSISRRC